MEKNNIKFSVLMSVYYREKAEYIEQCFESLLKQTVLADEWVVVKDGPLTDELETVLSNYVKKYPKLIKFVTFEENQGLGMALAAGVKECKNDIIARMDTDDICVPNRFEKQLREFVNNQQLDICGSFIKEFEGTIENIVSERKVPLTNIEIREYQKKRSAFNHMTVMYKKEAVLAAGNYQHALLMEDDLLWVNMLLNGCEGMNIPEHLVFARVGKDMIERRGGYSYFKKYKRGRKLIFQTGFISSWDYWYTIVIQLVVALMPLKLRKWFFAHYLRNK